MNMCSKYNNHSRLNSQHKIWGGGRYLAVNEHKNIHFDNEQDVHTKFVNHDECDYGFDWIC